MSAKDVGCYAARIVPALALTSLAVLLTLSLVVNPFGETANGPHHGEATIWQWILSVYLVALHALSVMFPVRLCYSLSHVVERMTNAAIITYDKEKNEYRTAPSERTRSLAKVASSLFVIIIPAYKEDVETLRSTLRVLAAHPQARFCYHVCRS